MSDFSEFLHEAFQLFGPITVSRMFGGQGVYRDGLMFALVHEETLYLKTDAESAREFEARGLGAFSFRRNDRVVATSYYQAPADILEDRSEAAAWARRAFEAALRAHAKKGRGMATAKQKAAARRNIRKAAAAAKKKRTIAHLPKKTRTALGKQGAAVAAKKRAKKKAAKKRR